MQKECMQSRSVRAAILVVTTFLCLVIAPLIFTDTEETAAGKTAKADAAAPAAAHAAAHTVFTPDDIKWVDAPSVLPPGGKIAVLEGDPSHPGPFTMRARFPAGYRIAAHWHPADERVTVLSGNFYMGMGDKLDMARGQKVPAGGFTLMPAKVHHYAWTEEETIIQLNGIGPWALIYVDPQDDPSMASTER